MKLQGIRVVDLSVFLPGPYLTMAMADHGAEVIKVEPPGEGDPGRHIGLADGPVSVFFRNVNRGKRCLTLDLKSAEGREALLALTDTADVFVESFRPGVMDRLGIGQATLRARNPRLVYCSISAFGQDGPYRDRPAHDLAVEALAGSLSINLGQDGKPAIPAVAIADIIASLQALSGVLMALLRRERTGRGDFIDAAMLDSMIAACPNIVGPVFAEGREPVAAHERTSGGSAFYRIYETADGGHVVLGGQEMKFVRNLLTHLGRPDLIALCEPGPGPHQQPVVDFLAATFRTATRAEWDQRLSGMDICFAPVKPFMEAFEDPQVAARGTIVTDEAGRRHIAPAARFADEPARPDWTAGAPWEPDRRSSR
ncbi:MAG: CaiB/BaiF CoA transferase family protein [Alphaproteobacteria bacterium]